MATVAALELLTHFSKNPHAGSFLGNETREFTETHVVRVGDVIGKRINNTFTILEISDKIVIRSKEPISRTAEEKFEFSLTVGQSKQIRPAMFDSFVHWGITLISIEEE